MKIRPLILFSSVVLVALILWGGQILINQLSSKQEKIQHEILQREDALLKRIQVKILETGYRQSRSGIHVVYFPVLVVEVTNISREALAKIRFASYFKKNGGVICGGIYDVDALQSREIKAVAITCSQSIGLKSSLRRFNLSSMEKSISFEIWVDYSFKPVKLIVGNERPVLEQALLITHIPLFYGAMPNLGLYSQPDGPFPNPLDLMPKGKIKEAQASYDQAVEAAVSDMVFVADAMYEAGADGINFDTTGAAGDPDFCAALQAVEILKKKYPEMCVEMGMAGEFILGLHGEMKYDGVPLAGLYPHQQAMLAEKAGVTIFGPVVNTNTSRSSPWNLSRAVTFMKACCEMASIPIHVNMGMGVASVPMTNHPPIDIVSRASTAMVEICRLDGL